MSTPSTRIVATCPVSGTKLVQEQEAGWQTEQEQDPENVEISPPAFDDGSVLVVVTRTKVDRDAIRREVEAATRAQVDPEALKDPANKDTLETQIQEAVEAQMAQLEIGEHVVTTHTLSNISPEGLKLVKKALKSVVPEWPK